MRINSLIPGSFADTRTKDLRGIHYIRRNSNIQSSTKEDRKCGVEITSHVKPSLTSDHSRQIVSIQQKLQCTLYKSFNLQNEIQLKPTRDVVHATCRQLYTIMICMHHEGIALVRWIVYFPLLKKILNTCRAVETAFRTNGTKQLGKIDFPFDCSYFDS